MPKRKDIKTILVIGSGPIIIGQAAEFVANVNFSSLRNLASNELFFTTFLNLGSNELFL